MPKRCTVQYRYLKPDDQRPIENLKDVLVDVLQRSSAEGPAYSSMARLRIIDLDQNGRAVILNKVSDPASWQNPVFCGQLIEVDPSSKIPGISQALEANDPEFVLKNLDLGSLRALKGALYFAVVGNHFGVIEGQEVKGRTLERYLTRLLQQAGELEPGQVVILNSSFRSSDGNKLREATELNISVARGRIGSSKGAAEEQTVAREAGSEKRSGATVVDLLGTLGWDKNAIAQLLSDVPPDGWLEGQLRLFIKERRRRRAISRATIDEALRNIDPEDLGIKGEGTEKDGLVKLSTHRTVAVVDSLLDASDAMVQIVGALREWADQGKIDCSF